MKCNCEKLIKSLMEYETPEAYKSSPRMQELEKTYLNEKLVIYQIDFSKISFEEITMLRSHAKVHEGCEESCNSIRNVLKGIPRLAYEVDFI